MKLALLFTKGISLKVWEEMGNLDRELKPYQELAKYFDEILLLTYGGKDDLKYQSFLPENIKILPNKQKIPSLIYSFLLPFLYQKELKRADVLKTNQMAGSWTAIIAKFFFRKKLIVRQGYQLSTSAQKNGIKLLIIQFLERLAYRRADAIIVTSKRDKKYIEEKYNILAEKIKYIPNYIDTELFKPLNISKENRICFIGRLEKEKNLFNLIKAVSDLDVNPIRGYRNGEEPQSKKTSNGVKLVIFGNGSQKKDLENFSKQLKADVEFKGNIPNKNLPMEINKSKLFILPSLYEGCPKVLLEAMACGLPVIGTDVRGINEIIKAKENGYLCGTDAFSVRKAIIEVLSNKGLQKKLSQNARKTILENFKFEKILETEKDIYENL